MSIAASASGLVLGKFFTGRIMLFIIAAIIAVIVIYKVVKKAIRTPETEEKTADSIDKDLNKEIDKEDLSYLPSVYKGYALVVYSALDGNYEDEEAVYDVFKKMNTLADVLQLIKDFGYRESTNWGWLTALNIKGTLPQWISQLFNSSEKKELNKILSNKGIQYEF